MVWYSHLSQNLPQFIVIHTVKGFGIVNKAEVGIFLELSCFFDDPVDVGNLISGSSAICKSSLTIQNFTVNVMLKPGLENFEHYFTSVWSSLVAQRLKCLPGMQETWVRSLGREDPLEKEMASHSSVPAWRIPGTGEPGGLPSMGLHRVGHD